MLVVLVACGGSTPRTVYYDLSTTELQPKRLNAAGPVVRFESFGAASGLGGDDIAIRSTDLRLDHYFYHRWRAPSAGLVTELMARAFEESGLFRRVDIDEFGDDADIIVSGTITRFEGVRRPQETVARIGIRLVARSAASREVLWSRQFARDVPVAERSVHSLVQAFRSGILSIASDAAPRVAEASPEVNSNESGPNESGPNESGPNESGPNESGPVLPPGN